LCNIFLYTNKIRYKHDGSEERFRLVEGGKPSGKGVRTFKNGDKETIHYANGQPQGEVVRHCANGDVVTFQSSQFAEENGIRKPHGKATRKFNFRKDGRTCDVEHFEYVKGTPQGDFSIYYGNKHNGFYSNSAYGDVETGRYDSRGRRVGTAVMRKKNGDEERFSLNAEGKRHGKAVMKKKNGDVLSFRYVNGDIKGPLISKPKGTIVSL
jgi:hypothetical protein